MNKTSLGKLPNPYDEAYRYINNAKQIIKDKAGKKDGEYAEVKFVQAAAGTAYVGVLLAIDEYLLRKEGNKFVKPKSIEEYRTRTAKQNIKLLSLLNEAYADLHISLYYHGIPSVRVMNNGLQTAEEIIEYIK